MLCLIIHGWWVFVFVMDARLLHCGLPQAETNQEQKWVKNKGRDVQKQNTNDHRNQTSEIPALLSQNTDRYMSQPLNILHTTTVRVEELSIHKGSNLD
jgi:hypothetical protein